MNIVVFFILLFLITLRGIRPIRFGMSGVCLRSNRATGGLAVCYGLTGLLCFNAGGSYRQNAHKAAGTRRAAATPSLVLSDVGLILCRPLCCFSLPWIAAHPRAEYAIPSARDFILRSLIMRLKLFLIALLVSSAASAAPEKATVTKIVDGDTIYVNQNGNTLKVRLIGIDTPESRYNSKAERDSDRSGEDLKAILAQGKRATAYLKSILRKGDTVTLEYDLQQYDKYGRTLAYVYLSDGRMLNELIIASGYASPMTIPPNIKHKDLFLKAYQEARYHKLGLWAEE